MEIIKKTDKSRKYEEYFKLVDKIKALKNESECALFRFDEEFFETIGYSIKCPVCGAELSVRAYDIISPTRPKCPCCKSEIKHLDKPKNTNVSIHSTLIEIIEAFGLYEQFLEYVAEKTKESEFSIENIEKLKGILKARAKELNRSEELVEHDLEPNNRW